MANKDNQGKRFIYIRSLKEKVPCTEQQFQEFYREATRIRKKEQYYHRCKCPKQFIWACDGDCENCEHHLGYGLLSLDAPMTEDGNTFLESEELAAPELMEELISDRILLEQLFKRLRELDPDADKIIEYWKDDCSISDREIAKRLGRKQRTFADQMKKIRTELRKVRGY
nr:sigma-70 family RNA polymerase sigma factor [uncultured Blautia sp.]